MTHRTPRVKQANSSRALLDQVCSLPHIRKPECRRFTHKTSQWYTSFRPRPYCSVRFTCCTTLGLFICYLLRYVLSATYRECRIDLQGHAYASPCEVFRRVWERLSSFYRHHWH